MASRVHLAPSTQARDESYMRNLVLPHLGDYRLGSITQTDLDNYTSLIAQGRGAEILYGN